MAWYEDSFDETYRMTCDAPVAPELAPQQVDDLERLLELQPPADILHVPCGQGRHSIELARRGYHVVGVDPSGYRLAVARRRAVEAALPVAGPDEAPGERGHATADEPKATPEAERMVGRIELVCADMRHFRRPGAFDVAVNLSGSFGHLEDEQQDARALRAVYENLRPGGRLVMEMAHKYWILQQGQQSLWMETPDGFTLERWRFDVLTERLETQRVVIAGGQVYRQRTSVRLYSLLELASLARSAGFELVGAYGSLDGTEPLRLRSRRLVAVFRRP